MSGVGNAFCQMLPACGVVGGALLIGGGAARGYLMRERGSYWKCHMAIGLALVVGSVALILFSDISGSFSKKADSILDSANWPNYKFH